MVFAMANTSDGPMTVKDLASMGGKARADSLSGARRKEIAKKAAAARWGKKASKKGATK